MKTSIVFSFSILLLIQSPVVAQSTVQRNNAIKSEILNNSLYYSIYLPPSYSESDDPYPVLYLLHGFGGNHNSWLIRCNIDSIMDSLIENKLLPEVIVVMPDAKKSYFINNYNSEFRYEDFFINEFVPYIDHHYKTIPSKGGRAIAGLSMGGYGALVLPVKNPDVFGNVIALSAAIRTDSMIVSLPQKNYEKYFGRVYGPNLEKTDRLTEHWFRNSPYHIMDTSLAKRLSEINWYIDCGMYDFLFEANKAFHELLFAFGIPHQYHMRIGAHNWEYWNKGFHDGMLFWNEQLTK